MCPQILTPYGIKTSFVLLQGIFFQGKQKRGEVIHVEYSWVIKEGHSGIQSTSMGS